MLNSFSIRKRPVIKPFRSFTFVNFVVKYQTMSTSSQVFQTNSKARWLTVKWFFRTFIFLAVFSLPVLYITYKKVQAPALPVLVSGTIKEKKIQQLIPDSLSSATLKKLPGFQAFLNSKSHIQHLSQKKHKTATQIRAGFYVDWDPQSFYSLQANVDKMNMVFPEWFFIDPKSLRLAPQIDTAALNLMKQHGVAVVPLINNINLQKGEGEFDGELLHRILRDPKKQDQLIHDIVSILEQNRLQGINIDFEELKEESDEQLIQFQQKLAANLHAKHLIVTQDIMPSNEDFNLKELGKYNDYLILMAYDEHYSTSVPGAVSSQKWIEKILDDAASKVDPSKIILGIAGYGYDWPEGEEAETVTYQQAISKAKIANASIDFNNDTYNNNYQYTETNGLKHQVYFTDAATNYNTIRFADEYGTAGAALWRLGSEDERIWKFYGRSLTDTSLKAKPFDYSKLSSLDLSFEKPDYIGEGEVLNVVATPDKGSIQLEHDTAEDIISEEYYHKLPTKYVIQKFGKVKKEVVLTFDDGPDPLYTPQILDILKREKVSAAFFVVGVEAENNLPLLRRIYDEGHEIGNHTFTHPNIAAVSKERALTEMETTRLLIESVTGHSTVLFRAPYNADSEPSTDVELRPVALSKQKNYYTVGESIDPNDWEPGVNADEIYQRTIEQYEVHPDKGIILLHDAGGNRAATVEALPRIIQYFKSKGIEFVSVSKLLNIPKDVIMPVVHQNILAVDNGIVTGYYVLQQFLYYSFWVAIVLGFVRILAMAIMAWMQKRRMNTLPLLPVTDIPGVSIIVPAYNEEINAVKTVNDLLNLHYPNFEILFVDDGSKDQTFDIVEKAFQGNDRVRVYTKPNGGKASALNFGIEKSQFDYLLCIDADTQLKEDALDLLMQSMLQKSDSSIGAVAGNVKVGNEHNLITKWQSIEYTTAQNFDRRAFDLINGITVVPGAIGAFSKKALLEAGGFTSDTLAEDCDLTIRILRAGYRVVNCTEAIAVTEAPETLKQFMKQRFRWSYGIIQAFWKNRDACFRLKYKGLGMVALPNVLIYQILLPILAPFADLMLIISLFWNRHDSSTMSKIGWFYLAFLLIDVLVSVIAFRFENEKLSKLIWLIPQRFAYRQLMYVVLYRSIRKALKGESASWGVLKRTGSVHAFTSTKTN